MIGVFIWKEELYMKIMKSELAVMRDDVVNELNRRGFNAVPLDKDEGYAVLHGIAEKSNPNGAPVLFMEKVGKGEPYADVGEWTDAFATAFNSFDDSYAEFADSLADPDFILKNVGIRLDMASGDDKVKRDCPLNGLEARLFVSTIGPEGPESSLSVDLHPEILKRAGLREDDVRRAAQERMENDVSVMSLAEAVGFPEDDAEGFPPVLIVTNGSRRFGASRLLTKKAVAELETRLHTDRFAVLPSSKHEVLVLPADDSTDAEGLGLMVSAINSEVVAPRDRLADKAFVATAKELLKGVE